MKYILLLLFIFPFQKESDFEKQLKGVKALDLPFHHKCGDDLPVTIYPQKNAQIFDFIPKDLSVVGIVTQNKNFIALLLTNASADYMVPYIVSFNNKGKVITKFEPYKIGCSEDEYYFGKAEFTITRDLYVNVTDSSNSYKRDKNEEIIKDSIVSKNHSYLFQFTKYGNIEEVR